MCRGEKRALDYISVPFEMVITAMEGITVTQELQETTGRLHPRLCIVSLWVRLQTVGSVQLLYWQRVANNLLV